ncbi:MAG: M23 family metallopeptidase [Anaerolineae bacterium]|nr:M23 family metallopeptidase [Anaerolineae bacterium]
MTGKRKHLFHVRRLRAVLLVGLALAALAGGGYLIYKYVWRSPQHPALLRWFDEPASRAELASSFDAPCPGYPFLAPSSGLVGGLPWNSTAAPYNLLNPHPGIDIFGAGAPGTIPVYAAYDGMLTREADWVATVIIRHDDPLHPGETIWTYYTHMADQTGVESYIVPAFPPGTYEKPVQQGTLLGYQGLYNGGSYLIGMHLHFSIVKSNPDGSYKNEAIFHNTLDPTPYLGLALNAADSPTFPQRCLPPP